MPNLDFSKLDLDDPADVITALEALARSTHIGPKTGGVLRAGARHLRKLTEGRIAASRPPDHTPDPPKRAI